MRALAAMRELAEAYRSSTPLRADQIMTQPITEQPPPPPEEAGRRQKGSRNPPFTVRTEGSKSRTTPVRKEG